MESTQKIVRTTEFLIEDLDRIVKKKMNIKNLITKAFGAVVSFYDVYMEETGHVNAQRIIFNRLKVLTNL